MYRTCGVNSTGQSREGGWLAGVETMSTQVTRTVLLVGLFPVLLSVGEKICNESGPRVSPEPLDTL